MWKTAALDDRREDAPASKPKLFVFLVRDVGAAPGATERAMLIVAASEAAAAATMRMRLGAAVPVYQYSLAGEFSDAELQEAIGPEKLEPMQTAAAIRYGALEFKDLLDIGEIEAMHTAAGKIEASTLLPIW